MKIGQYERGILNFPWKWCDNECCIRTSDGTIMFDNSCGDFGDSEELVWKNFLMDISDSMAPTPEYFI